MLIECKECEAVVDAQILKSYTDTDEAFPEIDFKYSFLKCPICRNPILAIQRSINREGLDEPTRIYPPQDNVSQSFPEPLKNAYQEALSCFKIKSFTAAAIMCRKTLEGICRVHHIDTGSLQSDLQDMKDKGIIESRLFEWAEALRIFGNEATHDINVTISMRDAKDIIEFTNALLEYIFTFNDKFNAFNKRRQSIKPKP
jgi:hypothetical protein